MPLTSALEVRKTLGIDEADAYLNFRYADDAELDDEVDKCIAWAVNWLTARVSSTYYTGTAGFDNDDLFKGAEEDMAGYRLFPRLKNRRVMGSHFALDQETSDRFEALIDEEIPRHVEMAIGPFVTIDIDSDDLPVTAPSIVATGIIDRTELISWPDQLAEALDQASGAIGVAP